MPASGVIRYGGAEYSFRPESSFGTLSWCRGVFPTRAGFTSATLVGQVKQVPFALFAGALWRVPCIMEINFISWTKSTFFPKKMALGSSGSPIRLPAGNVCLAKK